MRYWYILDDPGVKVIDEPPIANSDEELDRMKEDILPMSASKLELLDSDVLDSGQGNAFVHVDYVNTDDLRKLAENRFPLYLPDLVSSGVCLSCCVTWHCSFMWPCVIM